MNAINLYSLSRVTDYAFFADFERQLSKRIETRTAKQREITSLRLFVDAILQKVEDLSLLDGFYHSFEIPQISKEFDLLKLNDSQVINIELKSEAIENTKIKDQLIQNKHYLSHLDKTVVSYCVITDSLTVYTLDETNNLMISDLDALISTLAAQTEHYSGDISSLFHVSDYLISPLNTPDKFLDQKYFLTSQQDDFKKKILKVFAEKNNDYAFVGLTGAAGTGKTLLLYDLAVEMAKTSSCCIIHCGSLSPEHEYLREKLTDVKLIPIKAVTKEFDFSAYDCLFVDESQRIYLWQFELIEENTKKNSLFTVFSFDSNQVLSKVETRNDIAGRIRNLENLTLMELSNKIRTNKEVASFIKKLMDRKSHDTYKTYPSISLFYAENDQEAKTLLEHLKAKDYSFINYTSSRYKSCSHDTFIGLAISNTHHVVGLEYNNVVMLMDESFFYNEDKVLVAYEHPSPDYLYKQLLFQGLTRVREKLAIIVVRNVTLFQDILSIL